jgi:hypothetical protein
MGKGADGMLEFLREGSAGLDRFGREIEAAGAKVDEALIRKAQDLDDRWAALMESMQRKTQSWVLNTLAAYASLPETFKNPQGPGSAFQQITGQPGPLDTGFGGPPRRRQPTVAPVRNFGGAGSYYVPPKTDVANPEEESARKAAADAAERQAEQIQNVIEALQFENRQLQESELQQEINNQLRSAGVSATSEQGQAIAELVTKNYELARSYEESMRAGAEAARQQAEFRAELKETLMVVGDGFVDFGADVLFHGVKPMEAFRNALKDVGEQLYRMGMRKALEFGIDYLLGGQQMPARAGGGRTFAGESYMVGEHRPERFVPDANGYIQAFPSKQPGGGGTVNNISYAPPEMRWAQNDTGGLDVWFENRFDQRFNERAQGLSKTIGGMYGLRRQPQR